MCSCNADETGLPPVMQSVNFLTSLCVILSIFMSINVQF